MISRLWFAATILVAIALSTAPVFAGTIYTSQAAYNAALSGQAIAWSQNFEGFATGPYLDPFVIAAGRAEVRSGSADFITPAGPTGNVWLVPNTNSNPIIQGIGGSALGVSALSFNFGGQTPGNWIFNSSAGTASVFININSSSSFAAPNFVGWIGSSGETLNSAQFDHGGALSLDNITALNAVPEPTTMTLLGIGIVGMAGYVWRRRKLAV